MIQVVARMSPEAGLEGLRQEVLAKLPRTSYIDGIDLLREVRTALRTKAERKYETAEKDIENDASLADVVSSLAQQNLIEQLSYDNLMNVLNGLISEGKVSKKGGDPPTFQRID